MDSLLNRNVGVQNAGRVVGIISATGINDLLGRLDQIEKKDKVTGIIASSIIAVILFLALLFWFAKAGLVMGIEEPEWQTVGLIEPGADYGTDNFGSSDINNFRDPSPTPADRPTAVSSATDAAPKSSDNAASSNPAALGSITQDKDDVKFADVSGKESGSQNVAPNPNATGSDKPKTTATATNGVAPGGSNDGETDKVGNTGSPTATVLNPNGLFDFGTGIGGAGGRKPVRTELKGYNVQLEEKIKFEITIDPDGDVIFVKAPFAVHQELVAIGKANIMNWKFSPTEPEAGNLKTYVTISFRLK